MGKTAIYRQIHLTFWTDPKVDDCFTPEDKYFYLYLLTNPHTTLCGCYEIGSKQLMRETGYAEDTIQRLINRMQNVHNVIRYDPGTKEVLLLNWYKYNWTKSADFMKGVQTSLAHVKSSAFQKFIQNLINYGCSEIPEPLKDDTLYRPSTDRSKTTVAVAVTDTVSVKTMEYPKSIETLVAFCKEHDISEEFGRSFFDRYSANGWTMDNGESVRNWKNLLLRAWEKAKRQPKENPAAGTMQAIKQRREREAAETVTLADVDEWPPGSGEYLPKSEIEKRRTAENG